MRAVNQQACKVLDQLTRGLGSGQARKVDNSTAFMSVHVNALGGNCYSVAHYYEQNGDLVCDPDMVFWRGHDDRYYPVSFEMGGRIYQEAVSMSGSGEPLGFKPKLQRDLAVFAGTWMRNIKEQQQL